MTSLKRQNMRETIEISDGESGAPSAKRAKKLSSQITIDLTQDENESDSSEEHAPATKTKPPSSPLPAAVEDIASLQTGRPTPPALPSESVSKMGDIPEIADRYVPSISVEENTEYRNPFKFCVKPPYWQKWSGKDYLDFVEELRSQFDPHPFSRYTGKPVEEILHVWSALVAKPLYDTIEAQKRGQEGIQQHFEAVNKFGTPNRPWAGGKIKGELDNIKAGTVLLITQAEGNKEEIKLDELSKADINYLSATLTKSEWKILKNVSETEQSAGTDINFE